MSSTKPLNLNGGKNLRPHSVHPATTRGSKQLHFDPRRMAVMDWSGSAPVTDSLRLNFLFYTSFELHSPLVLEIPAQHSQYLPCKAELRCPGPHHRETDPPEGLRQVQGQGHRSQSFFSCSVFEPLHCQRNFPRCLLGSSISPVCSVPVHAIPLLPGRHLRCSQGFPPTNQRRHERNRALTCYIYGNQVQACCGHFPLCPPSQRTPRFHPSFPLSSPRGP